MITTAIPYDIIVSQYTEDTSHITKTTTETKESFKYTNYPLHIDYKAIFEICVV